MTRYRAATTFVFVTLFAAAVPALAQNAPAPSREELLERVRQLESQLNQMRGELAFVREALAVLAHEEARPTYGELATAASETLPSAAPPTVQAARSAAASERKPGGFAVGPWQVQPYGSVYFNAFGNSGGSNNADLPLFAAAGVGNLSASVRQTRLGVRVDGPKLAGGKLGGVFEADFFGGFPPIGVGEDFGLVRLRLAYARVDWEHFAVEAGQDWMVFAPNNPVSIAAAAIPQMTSAGNAWARLPQIRVEWRGGDRVKWLGQAAVLAPATGDFPPTTNSLFLLQPGAGARSRVPYFQVRAAATRENWLGLGKPATLGASVHYGRSRITSTPGNLDLDSVGAALDWNFPVAPRLSLLGETFFGRNLAGFQAAVFQGVNSDFAVRSGTTLVPAGVRALGTRGGWAQLGFAPPGTEKLTFYAGYGLDDPRDTDLVSLTPHDWRLRNQAWAVSFLHKPLPQVSWGVEFRRLETQFLQSGRGTNNHVNLGLTVSF